MPLLDVAACERKLVHELISTQQGLVARGALFAGEMRALQDELVLVLEHHQAALVDLEMNAGDAKLMNDQPDLLVGPAGREQGLCVLHEGHLVDQPRPLERHPDFLAPDLFWCQTRMVAPGAQEALAGAHESPRGPLVRWRRPYGFVIWRDQAPAFLAHAPGHAG